MQTIRYIRPEVQGRGFGWRFESFQHQVFKAMTLDKITKRARADGEGLSLGTLQF